MAVGDIVCVYTHVQSDYDHSTRDHVGIVLSESDEGVYLVIFPPGGPVRFETLREYDPDTAVATGHTYLRPLGSAPPDFSPLDYSSHPEWVVLTQAQARYLAMCPPEEREKLAANQLDERKALYRDLDTRYGRHQ